jgi:hypothetical protein
MTGNIGSREDHQSVTRVHLNETAVPLIRKEVLHLQILALLAVEHIDANTTKHGSGG